MMESSSFQPSVRRTTMKMAWVSVASVFLLCCFAVASEGCDKSVAVGQSFNVSLGYDVKSAKTLRWLFNGNIIYNKRSGSVVVGKSDEVNADGSLKLTNLKKSQSGKYLPEVYNNDGKLQTLKITTLCVLDPVKKPKLTATCQDEKVKFVCDLGQQPPDATLEWLQNKIKIANKPGSILEKRIEELKKDKLVCKVSNKVSSEESNDIIHSCGSTSIAADLGLPDELLGISIWVFLGGGGGVVILLMIIVIICCVRTKRTRKLRLQDEEELRLEWTNTSHHPNHPPLPDHPPPHHPNRHHHHHHQQQQQQQQEQQQAPGNTGPRQSRSKQNRQPRARAPEPNGQPQPSPRRTGQPQKPASDADDEQPPPLPQPRKKGPKTQLD